MDWPGELVKEIYTNSHGMIRNDVFIRFILSAYSMVFDKNWTN